MEVCDSFTQLTSFILQNIAPQHTNHQRLYVQNWIQGRNIQDANSLVKNQIMNTQIKEDFVEGKGLYLSITVNSYLHFSRKSLQKERQGKG